MKPHGWLRWLYPGMRIKRWLALSGVSMGLFVLGLLEVIGAERIRRLYSLLPPAGAARAVIVGIAMGLGIFGFGLGLNRLVRSIAHGVAPGRREKPGDMIFRTRLLERGPRVVAIGGGTGLSTLLRGLKEETANITAVVTVMDDGGSSGRLRAELDVLPPGDVRNCIIALAADEARMAELLQHRFRGGGELAGHSLGNLLLVGLEQATGGFDRAVEAMSQILAIRGEVLPATLTKCHLVARMEDGEWVEGESRISSDPRRIEEIRLSKEDVPPYGRVLEAISRADLILLGPGSLYTSIIPNLLVNGIADEIERAPAEKFLVANLMTQPGETDGFTLRDHLRVLDQYVSVQAFDGILVNNALPPEEILTGYRAERAAPVADDLEEENEYGLSVVRADLIGTATLEGKVTVKHDPRKLARAIVENTRAFAHRPSTP
ncbi:YvcK family protein [Candidatus Bipolaricaulota bacterium]|nr:YvcK family protein [Candidatus Bipolaricaulota bacterium]